MKTKEVLVKEAITRNEKQRAKYIAQYFDAHPQDVGSKDGEKEATKYADQKIGIPARQRS